VQGIATEQSYWVALTLTPGLGPTRSRMLLDHFGEVAHVFQASLTELEAAGLPAVSAQFLASGEALGKAEDELVKARDAGATVVMQGDREYPERLKEIYDPPLVLYIRGDAGVLARAGIAVVGTRHPTPYGTGMAGEASLRPLWAGIIIISSMAPGLDTTAHRGALEVKGKTIAVFGTGVDVIYPRENQKLSEQIVATGGALISEFPMEHLRLRRTFRSRNRNHQWNVDWRARDGSG
jgi:DNA processing protein